MESKSGKICRTMRFRWVRKRVKILTLDFIMYTEVSVMTTERIYLESSKRKTRENKMTL